MKAGTESNVKFKRLKRRLGLPLYAVTGILEALWAITASSAPRGDIGKFTNEDIAAAIEFEGDEDELVDALIASGWVDECGVHRLVVHDWKDHAPNYIKGNIRHKGGFVSANEDHPQGTTPKGPPPGDRPPRVTPPSQVKSSQVKSSQTLCVETASPSSPDGDGRTPEKLVSFWNSHFKEHPEVPKVQKLTPDRKRKLKSRLRDDAWRDAFKLAIAKLPLSGDGWQPPLDWMIANETNVHRLAEGAFDWRAEKSRGDPPKPRDPNRKPVRDVDDAEWERMRKLKAFKAAEGRPPESDEELERWRAKACESS